MAFIVIDLSRLKNFFESWKTRFFTIFICYFFDGAQTVYLYFLFSKNIRFLVTAVQHEFEKITSDYVLKTEKISTFTVVYRRVAYTSYFLSYLKRVSIARIRGR